MLTFLFEVSFMRDLYFLELVYIAYFRQNLFYFLQHIKDRSEKKETKLDVRKKLE